MAKSVPIECPDHDNKDFCTCIKAWQAKYRSSARGKANRRKKYAAKQAAKKAAIANGTYKAPIRFGPAR